MRIRAWRPTLVELLLSAMIVGVISMIAAPHWSPSMWLTAHQRYQSLSFQSVEAAEVIDYLVQNATRPYPVMLCRDLASRRVTITTDGTTSLGWLVTEIGEQIDARTRLYGGMHGESVFPHFMCQDTKAPIMVFRKGQRPWIP